LKLRLATSNPIKKKDCDGIEAKLFQVSKIKYGVKVQTYHGKRMTGTNTQKVMENAAIILTSLGSVWIDIIDFVQSIQE